MYVIWKAIWREISFFVRVFCGGWIKAVNQKWFSIVLFYLDSNDDVLYARLSLNKQVKNIDLNKHSFGREIKHSCQLLLINK